MLTATKVGETLKLTAEQDFIITNAQTLQAELLKGIEDASGLSLVLDLSKTSMIDSIGIKLLVGLYQSCKKQETPFSLKVTSESILKVLTLCKMNQLIEIQQEA